MPLVGGNELSFFSISSAICFYLVINKSSSVWWQQAEGCVLCRRDYWTRGLSGLAVFPPHTHADATARASTCATAHPYSVLFFNNIHVIGHITAIKLTMLLSNKNIILIIFNHH